MKDALLLIALIVIGFLGSSYEANKQRSKEVNIFYNEVEDCLADEEVEFVKTPLELFQQCRFTNDTLDDIEDCMANQEIELSMGMNEYFQQCKKNVGDYYDYINDMQDDGREPFVR
ncbi:hypothetical protein [Lonepinella sp. BR2474]|uniref:hypothetical protein n=1 Tax=Lonepinella sp. BR2474 TaxID=3434548 RepID=UPI003F6DF3BC